MPKIVLIFSFLIYSYFSLSQFQFDFKQSLPVIKAGNALKMPWAGGLNYVQVSQIDIDFDGDLDLFVFDRSSDQIRIFKQIEINGVKSYEFASMAYLQFPNDLRYRVQISDYNQDGKNDIFTYGIGGMKVYKNIGNAQEGLKWELAKSLLYSNYNGSELNLYVSSSDIPALVDVENDGDLDILTFHIGGEHLQYHQNQSMDLYSHSDSLVFVLKNECWGGFKEDVNSNSVILNDPSAPCAIGNVPGAQKSKEESEKAHAGSTVLALDMDGSGVKDLILGDVAYPNMNLLLNGGTAPNTNSLMISADVNFPSNSTPINMQLFPAAFWEDVDFDGKKDLIVAPNAKNASENETSVMKYRNSGTNSNPNFIFETKSFLQSDMIEHGTASVPILVDINNDGLLDLFVANYYSYKPTLSKYSRIAYYRNTGTSTAPKFTYIENDFLNLSSTNYGLKITPTFGDLDGDSKKDLLLGLENGTLVYYRNTSTGSNPTFANPVLNYTDNSGTIINVGQFAAPQLFDLNKDGKLDLIIGKKTGELVYYQNVGTTTNPQFELQNSNLGGIDVATTNPDGFPIPNFFSYNDTTYLMLGAYDGAIRFYDSIETNLTSGSTFHLRTFDFLGLQKEIGTFSACAVSDIDANGKLDLFIGQDLGGIFHLEHSEGSNLGININESVPEIIVFPNPFENEITIKSSTEEALEIYNYLGQKVEERKIEIGENKIDFAPNSSGIYLLKFKNSGSVTKLIRKISN
ncbi:MAG: T9SS type A sorting domain-containing protein [Flavobacteriales bacterium]|nr:T9SS type A sorting domain-containing protein [Flavobacteriales bacterium]